MVAVEAAVRKPRSEAQREAARRNGAKSRGPITAEGKARASKNAIRHGLWGSVHLVTPGEDAAALEALRAAFARDYAPKGVLAACLADRLALTFWKLARCDRLEVQLATMAPRPQRGWLEAEKGMPAALSRLPERALLERARARLDRFLVRGIALLEGSEPGPRRRRAAAAAIGSDPSRDEAGFGDDGLEPAPEEDAMPAARFFSSSAAPVVDSDERDSDLADEPAPASSAAAPEPGTHAFPDGAADDPAALVEASARRLLAAGRAGEAVAVLRRLPRPPRPAAESAAADELPSPEDRDAAIDAAVAELSPEARALWDSLGYEHWVVPPERGRMCLSSLTNEWVTPADRWRVLEEVRRLGDPAETARVLARFHEAGLDPGRDHPDFAGAGSERQSEPPEPIPEEEELPPLLRNNPVLRRVVEESDAYHAACRLRREAERWKKHAKELGVPIPAHGLAAIDAAARVDPENPRPPAPPEPAQPAPLLPEREPWPLCPGWHGRPRDPRTGALLPLPQKDEKKRNEPEPSPPSAESREGPRAAPPLPDPSDWPFSEEDEPAAIAEARAAREPRPAPAEKTTTPKAPPEPIPWTPARLGPFAPRWYRERMAQARREDPSPNEPEP